MAVQAFTDAKIYFGGYDFSGYINQCAVDFSAEMLDGTTFGATTRVNVSGLKSAAIGVSGFVDLVDDSLDEQFFANIGVSDMPVSVVPQGDTVANRAFFMQSVQGIYSPGARIGQLLAFDAKAFARGPLVRGELTATGAKTVTGVATGVQLGALSAAQKVYAAVHVLSVSGTATPTITVKIQSDDNSGFTSATDRITFTAATAITAELSSVAGAVTDDYWRAVWTVSGTNPSLDIRVLFGIL